MPFELISLTFRSLHVKCFHVSLIDPNSMWHSHPGRTSHRLPPQIQTKKILKNCCMAKWACFRPCIQLLEQREAQIFSVQVAVATAWSQWRHRGKQSEKSSFRKESVRNLGGFFFPLFFLFSFPVLITLWRFINSISIIWCSEGSTGRSVWDTIFERARPSSFCKRH